MHLLHPTERHHGLMGAKMEGKGQGGRKRGKVVDGADEKAAARLAKPSAHLHARTHAHACANDHPEGGLPTSARTQSLLLLLLLCYTPLRSL
ncbi:hypothetical protein ECG_00616 [Echinococcus granulosus]|uniref:Uncharacterized protein n=1 Tax=Echinococcus granulosus TaxID=6210 RepID=A0A068WDL2_ECHGR|nr:hypothetical protein ECG_00616 [Echinococcus granulosus]CDS16532.1 hypothetical protein EgrG_000895800 [Echinococcus granulosus]